MYVAPEPPPPLTLSLRSTTINPRAAHLRPSSFQPGLGLLRNAKGQRARAGGASNTVGQARDRNVTASSGWLRRWREVRGAHCSACGSCPGALEALDSMLRSLHYFLSVDGGCTRTPHRPLAGGMGAHRCTNAPACCYSSLEGGRKQRHRGRSLVWPHHGFCGTVESPIDCHLWKVTVTPFQEQSRCHR